MFQNHGRFGHSHEFSMIGHNYRMTEVQGAVGLIQLRRLEDLNARRIANAKLLTELISGTPGITPPHIERTVKHVFHLYNVLIEEAAIGFDRDEFLQRLGRDYGIAGGTHYEPIHLAEIYLQRGSRLGDCPVAELIGTTNLTLPVHPRIGEDGIRYMAEAVRSVAGG